MIWERAFLMLASLFAAVFVLAIGGMLAQAAADRVRKTFGMTVPAGNRLTWRT